MTESSDSKHGGKVLPVDSNGGPSSHDPYSKSMRSSDQMQERESSDHRDHARAELGIHHSQSPSDRPEAGGVQAAGSQDSSLEGTVGTSLADQASEELDEVGKGDTAASSPSAGSSSDLSNGAENATPRPSDVDGSPDGEADRSPDPASSSNFGVEENSEASPSQPPSEGDGGAEDPAIDALLSGTPEGEAASFTGDGGGEAEAASASAGPQGAVRSYQIIGGSAGRRLGNSFDSIGDIDGDGHDDFVIGIPFEDNDEILSGQVYVVTSSDLRLIDAADGQEDGIVDLRNFSVGTSSYQITGAIRGGLMGWEVASAGDVDGDGLEDILIGAPDTAGPAVGTGHAYLLTVASLGSADIADGDLDRIISSENIAASGPGSYQFVSGPDLKVFGGAVSSAGDIDGDGLADLLIGAPSSLPNAPGSSPDPGSAFLVTADRLAAADAADGLLDGVIAVENIPTNGLTGSSYQFVSGSAGDDLGFDLSMVGDIDNDGLSDFLIGVPYADSANSNSGNAFLVSGANLNALDAADGSIDGIIDVSEISGLSGNYEFVGSSAGDLAGLAVSGVGDVDGDGLEDFMIASPVADDGGINSGNAYLISSSDMERMDRADGTDDNVIDLENIAGIGVSYKFVGAAPQDGTGLDVSGAGDIDGDGLADLLIGARRADDGGTNSGNIYLISSADLHAADLADGVADGVIEVENIPMPGGSYQFVGTETDDRAGYSISSAGDVDGDGLDDIMIGAILADGFNGGSGEAYIIRAQDFAAADRADGFEDGVIDLDLVNEQGFETEELLSRSYQIIGEGGQDYLGVALSNMGDIDGDGFADILISAPESDGTSTDGGTTYIVSAQDLAAADAADGDVDGVILASNIAPQAGSYRFFGEDIGGPGNTDISLYSSTVSFAGDVDGDGLSDILIGSRNVDDNGFNSGAVYLVTAQDLAALDAADGSVDGDIDLSLVGSVGGTYKFVGDSSGDFLGRGLSSVGDIDGDGRDDFIIGAGLSDETGLNSGAAYLVTAARLESADALDGTEDGIINVSNIAGEYSSYVFTGTEGDFVGLSVSGAGDFDGDGFADLMISASGDGISGGGQGITFLMSSADLFDADKLDGVVDGVIDIGNIKETLNSYELIGPTGEAASGYQVTSAGDVDFDGLEDFLITSPNWIDPAGGGDAIGSTYLVTARSLETLDAIGPTGARDGRILLDDAPGVEGSYRFEVEDVGDVSIQSISGGGDIDGDELADIIIGARSLDANGVASGAIYIVTMNGLAEADAADGTVDGVVNLANIADSGNSYKIIGNAAGELAGFSVSSAGDVDGDGLADLLVGVPRADNPSGVDSGETFIILARDLEWADQRDGSDDGIIILDNICFARGTRIATRDGERPIEELRAGDLVQTMDNGLQPVKWIGSRKTAGYGKNAPIRIKAGALENHRDLIVTQQHRVLVRSSEAQLLFAESEVLVAAKFLVDGKSIVEHPVDEIEVFHILFDRHEIIFSEGCPTESLHAGSESIKSLTAEQLDEIRDIDPEFLDDRSSEKRQSARLCLTSAEAVTMAVNSSRRIQGNGRSSPPLIGATAPFNTATWSRAV